MLSKTTLILVSYLTTVGFASNNNYQVASELSNDQLTNNINLEKIDIAQNISRTNSLESVNYMTLTSMGRKNGMGNPVYLLSLYANGQKIGDYPTVTGRADTQNRNRNVSGTEAPLPRGRYSVAGSIVAGTHPEVGGRFLPIYPLFPTGRSALGIHYDPSFNKSNGQDGTAGCIALTNKQDLDRVLDFVRSHPPKYLEVQF